MSEQETALPYALTNAERQELREAARQQGVKAPGVRQHHQQLQNLPYNRLQL